MGAMVPRRCARTSQAASLQLLLRVERRLAGGVELQGGLDRRSGLVHPSERDRRERREALGERLLGTEALVLGARVRAAVLRVLLEARAQAQELLLRREPVPLLARETG